MTDLDRLEAAEPEEAFAALADGTRVDILQALWAAEASAVSFSALREAVGMADSGQFNYHLDTLTDRFVRKTDDGYELTLAGTQIVGAIHAGAITMDGDLDPIDLPEPCPVCGGDRTFRYEDERVTIECAACEVQMESGVPPGVFEGYDRQEIPRVATRYLRKNIRSVRSGFCNQCDGPVDATLLSVRDLLPEDADPPPAFREMPMVLYECRRCGATLRTDLGTLLLDHPRIATFHDDHGADVRGPDWWQYGVFDPERAVFVDEDPPRAELTYVLGDASLRVEVDADLEVVAVERVDG